MNLRTRMILAAVLPVTSVTLILSAFFFHRHFSDLEQGLRGHGAALAKQAAVSAEFAAFTGDREALNDLARGLGRSDTEITALAIVGTDGDILANYGSLHRHEWPPLEAMESKLDHPSGTTFAVPVVRRMLAVVDEYSGEEKSAATPYILAHIVLELSSRELRLNQIGLLLFVITSAIVGAVAGSWLALRIARSINEPMLQAIEVVARLGAGDNAARIDERDAGPLQALASGINAMAAQVQLNQDDLQQRIAAATTEIARQRDAAEQATAAKSRFLAAASHDLRQPLHALGLFVARLTRTPPAGADNDLVGHVAASVASLQDLLDTLLDLSRLEAGALQVKPECVDLQPLLAGVVRDFAAQAAAKQIALTMRSRPFCVNCDPRLVERLLINLVSNALRYTEQGRVLVACRRRGARLRVEVWDTGCGIPLDQQAAVFGEYVQLGNPERDRRKGLGLGLAICRHIATALSTSIGLRSVPGRGSVFWFELPLAEALGAGAPKAAGDAEETLLTGRILVVDDDELVLQSTGEALVGWGGDVDLAADAAEALTLASRSSGYRAAICDVHLPGDTDGVALGLRLQQLYPGLSIILVTADTSPLLKLQAREAGFPLLRKPFAAARLRATLLGMQPPHNGGS